MTHRRISLTELSTDTETADDDLLDAVPEDSCSAAVISQQLAAKDKLLTERVSELNTDRINGAQRDFRCV